MCKISVVVPIYNMGKYLDKCIDSIRRQSLNDIEIILIDDGSTDNSIDICCKHKKEDDRVKIFSQDNSGQAEARNLGINKANGKYICFVDSDDWIEENYCENLLRIVEERQIDIGICNYQCVNKSKISKGYTNISSEEIFDSESNNLIGDRFLYRYIFKEAGGSPCNKIYNLKLLKFNNIRFYNNKYAEDLMFNTICLQYAKTIAYTKDVLYNYRIRDKSTTRAYRNDYFIEYINMIQQYEQFMNNIYLDRKYEGNCMLLTYSAIINSLNNWFIYSKNIKELIKLINQINKSKIGRKYLCKINQQDSLKYYIDSNFKYLIIKFALRFIEKVYS